MTRSAHSVLMTRVLFNFLMSALILLLVGSGSIIASIFSIPEILGFASNTVSGYEAGRLEIPEFMDLVLEALEARRVKEFQT